MGVADDPAGCTQRAALRTRTKALQRATQHFQAGDVEAFYETLMMASFRNSCISVTLANPNLPDCPLVGVSQGFQQMTGYTRSEILGQNCRFLNYGCPMPAKVRHELRIATRTHKRFVGVLTNRRKNGEVFQNLLHMSSLRVGNSMYLLGIQADVTHADVNLQEQKHMDEINRIVDAIFASNINAWAAIQAANFGHKKMDSIIPWYAETQLVPRYQSQVYTEARETFVSVALSGSMSGTRLCCSNTFLEVRSEESPGERLTRLRMVSSEPVLGTRDAELLENIRLPAQAYRDALEHPRPGASSLPPRGAPHDQADEHMSLKSKGSLLHPDGCTPCSFHCYSQIGCNKGELCAYCHMDHPKRTRRRGKKKPKSCAASSAAGVTDSREQPQLPAPTPMNLMPLLGALELLSPLPDLRIAGELTKGSPSSGPTLEPSSQAIDGDDTDRELPEDCPVPDLTDLHKQLSLRYNESTIVLAKGQWKQVLPFVRGEGGALTFTVEPPLPRGFVLHRSTQP